MKYVIEVNDVSKVFPLNRVEPISLRHEAGKVLRNLLRSAAEREKPMLIDDSRFFALRDINFRVRKGGTLGIIGRNGSGKTTLLRLLSGIMRPSTGSIRVQGRFASLIALGAGFIPPLSGRQNIHLNAAFYGLGRDEVLSIIDAVVAFSGLGRFIDMPVKDYSSGMRARLGFSIAVHILPDVIFIDEVLSVGDEDFRVKSGERIQQMAAEGRTIVLVSHSLGSVQKMCERTIWLDRGKLMMDGPSADVIETYRAFLGHG